MSRKKQNDKEEKKAEEKTFYLYRLFDNEKAREKETMKISVGIK
jgi:hypothetical protein